MWGVGHGWKGAPFRVRYPCVGYRGTKRPQNVCKDCGYTWFPRGSNLSRRCPGCGSGRIRVSYAGCFTLVLVAAGCFWFMGRSPDQDAAPRADSPLHATTTTTRNPEGVRGSMCGAVGADRRPATVGSWERWECRSVGQTERWSECLRRAEYTAHTGHGCPGEQRCCPPANAAASAEETAPASAPDTVSEEALRELEELQ